MPNTYNSTISGTTVNHTYLQATVPANNILTTGHYNGTSWTTFNNGTQASLAPSMTVENNIVTFTDIKGNHIVSLKYDGTVDWNSNLTVDQAMENFAGFLHLTAEQSAGIKDNAKKRIRDQLFEEIIEAVGDKDSISKDDLILMHRSAKIMDKLKGL